MDDAWACLYCHTVNMQSDAVCTQCQYPKSDLGDLDGLAEELAAPPSYQQRASPGGKAGGKGAPVAGVDGNWACPHCQNVNFAVRDACNRCQAPKPGAFDAPKRAAPPAWAPPQQAPGGKGGPVAGVDGNWVCIHCQNVNFAVRHACNRCQAPKPVQVAPHKGKGGSYSHDTLMWTGGGPPVTATGAGFKGGRVVMPPPMASYHQPPAYQQPQAMKGGGKSGAGPVAGVDGNWQCQSCQNVNFAVRSVCNRCQAPKAPSPPPAGKGGAPVAGVDGNWECPQCRNVNFAVRSVCNRCQAPQPWTEVYQPYQPAPQAYQPPHKGGKKGGNTGGAPVAGVDGNWACLRCNNVNFAVREACNRCQEPKPPSGDISDADLIAQLSQPANEEPAAKRSRLY